MFVFLRILVAETSLVEKRPFPTIQVLAAALISSLSFVGLGLAGAKNQRELRTWMSQEVNGSIWSNYSDLTRPHPKWWFSKGNSLISGKSRLVKYNNLARSMVIGSMGYFTDPYKWGMKLG